MPWQFWLSFICIFVSIGGLAISLWVAFAWEKFNSMLGPVLLNVFAIGLNSYACWGMLSR